MASVPVQRNDSSSFRVFYGAIVIMNKYQHFPFVSHVLSSDNLSPFVETRHARVSVSLVFVASYPVLLEGKVGLLVVSHLTYDNAVKLLNTDINRTQLIVHISCIKLFVVRKQSS